MSHPSQQQAQPLNKAHEGQGVAIVSQTTAMVPANTNASLATGDSATYPQGVVAGTSANHAVVVALPVPHGANYVDLYHCYEGSPSSGPSIKAFGKLPKRSPSASDVSLAKVSASFAEQSEEAYQPLPEKDTNNFNPTLPIDIGLALPGATISTPITLYLKGSEVLYVLVSAATVGGSASSIAAVFGR
jgi:hypothetical protein